MKEKYLISDICDVGSSKRIYLSEYQDTGIPFYRGKEIIEKDSNRDISNELFISQERYNEIKEKFGAPKVGDILMTAVGTIGVSWYVDESSFYFKDGNLIWFKNFKEDIINSRYLYYIFKSKVFIEKIKNISIGSTQKALTIEQVKKIKIEFPEISIQNRIVKILDNINNKIKLNNEINNNLQELINKTFIEYFVNYNIDNVKLEFVESDIGLIPKGWSIGILSDIVEFSNGYGFDSKKMLDKNENETFSVFKMGNINIGGGINKSKTKSWMKKEDCEGLDKFIAKKGDILMCMTDMKNSGNPLLGHTALIDKDNEFVINQRVGILRCTKGISYEYVYTLSNLDFFISDLRSRANSGVQVNLTTTGICNTQILIPDKDCIDKFNKIAKPLYEKKFNIMQQNETVEQLRDTLLPKLMNGEIDLDNIEI